MGMASLYVETWVHELVGLSITASGSEQQLSDCVRKGTSFLGFELFCYGLQVGFPLNRQIFTWLHNHPEITVQTLLAAVTVPLCLGWAG